jgi:hypothetical protein
MGYTNADMTETTALLLLKKSGFNLGQREERVSVEDRRNCMAHLCSKCSYLKSEKFPKRSRNNAEQSRLPIV